jgi:hypothetical protein
MICISFYVTMASTIHNQFGVTRIQSHSPFGPPVTETACFAEDTGSFAVVAGSFAVVDLTKTQTANLQMTALDFKRVR